MSWGQRARAAAIAQVVGAASVVVSLVYLAMQIRGQTRESRLAKSTFQYLRRSGQTILRIFALYYPFKFFFRLGRRG